MQWQESAKVNGWFVFYRLLMAALTFGVLIGSFLENQYLNTIGYWFIYYTDIGYFGLTIHMTLSAAVAIEHLIIQRGKYLNEIIRWIFKTIFHQMASRQTWPSWPNFHGCRTMSWPWAHLQLLSFIGWLYIVQVLLSYDINYTVSTLSIFCRFHTWSRERHGPRIQQCVHHRGSIYSRSSLQAASHLSSNNSFSVIYWAAGGVTADGGTAIYPILDWDKLDSTLPILAAMLVALFPFQVILWSLHLLRDFLYRKAFHVKMKSPVMARDNEAFESNDRTDDIPVVEQKTLFWYDSFNANSFRVNTNDASELFVVRWATEWEQRIFFENEDTDVVNILKKKNSNALRERFMFGHVQVNITYNGWLLHGNSFGNEPHKTTELWRKRSM